eukprot:3109093-Amphidinium_carterae.1
MQGNCPKTGHPQILSKKRHTEESYTKDFVTKTEIPNIPKLLKIPRKGPKHGKVQENTKNGKRPFLKKNPLPYIGVLFFFPKGGFPDGPFLNKGPVNSAPLIPFGGRRYEAEVDCSLLTTLE